MNKKLIIGAAALIGAVATPIALTLSSSSNSYKANNYSITLAESTPITTLNKFKAASSEVANQYTGLFNTALIRTRPMGDENGGLETSLSIEKLTGYHTDVDFVGDTYDKYLKGPKVAETIDNDLIEATNNGYYGGWTNDLATKMVSIGGPNNDRAIAFRLRNTRYWNGDRLSAEDFIETIKVALNVKNGVPWAWELYRIMNLKNAREIWDAQTIDKKTFEEAIKEFPLGVVAGGEVIEPDDMATSEEGKAYYKKEAAAGRKRHDSVIYLFNGNDASNFINKYSSSAICSPTNIRKFKEVGFDDWGTTKDKLMGIGPYKITYFDLDYKVVADRWDGYWDYGRVLTPQIILRVLPDVSSQIQLFRDGKVGKVSFGSAMLPQFFGDEKLKRFVKPTDWLETLSYLAFNTKTGRKNSKVLMNEDFRNAIQYVIDRQQYLSALSADNSYPAESFSTVTRMQDDSKVGVINYSIGFRNRVGYMESSDSNKDGDIWKSWNEIYGLPGDKVNEGHKMFTRDELTLKSTDLSKNDYSDRVKNIELGKRYYAKFKRENPEYSGININLQVDATVKEKVTILKQDIEENLPGIKITIIPKPSAVEKQVAAKMEWDMRFTDWSYDYWDVWTYYHFLTDKLHINETMEDPIERSGINKSIVSDGFTLVDWIASKIASEDKDYFSKKFFNGEISADEANQIVAQFLRMESTVNSDNPNANGWKGIDPKSTVKGYEPRIWTTKPTKKNGYLGYKGEFDKFEPYYPGASQWDEKLAKFIEDNPYEHIDGEGDVILKIDDVWKLKKYRYSILYPLIEKMIRVSALGIPITRIQNNYIASRFIGEINFAGTIRYYGWIYAADNIPPSRFKLPGTEAITK